MSLAIALVVASCGGGGENVLKGKREVGIAFVGATTGPNGEIGANFRDGARMALEEENERGGDLTIRLREFDTAGDAAQARAVKAQFIADRSILGVVGPVLTGETNALVSELQAANLVTISASATEAGLPSAAASRAVVHRLAGDQEAETRGLAEYLSTLERPTGVAYAHDGSEPAKQLVTAVERKTSALGVRTATVEGLDPASQDLSEPAARIAASGAGGVFVAGPFAAATRLNQALVRQAAGVTVVTGSTGAGGGFAEDSVSADANGVRLACTCNVPLDSSTGRLGQFYDDYKRRIKRDPGPYSAEGYDAASMLIRGIKSGNETREKLLDYVENRLGRYEGVSKVIEFAPDGTLKADTLSVYEVRGNELSLLKTVMLSAGPSTTSTTRAGSTSTTSARTPTTRRRTTTSSTIPTTTSTTAFVTIPPFP